MNLELLEVLQEIALIIYQNPNFPHHRKERLAKILKKFEDKLIDELS
jgi:hypothetical protein